MLVGVNDLHSPRGRKIYFYLLSIRCSERPPPCWPTTRLVRACLVAFAWASSLPTTPVFSDPLPSLPCPPHSRRRGTRKYPKRRSSLRKIEYFRMLDFRIISRTSGHNVV